jgi:hypothetical protein
MAGSIVTFLCRLFHRLMMYRLAVVCTSRKVRDDDDETLPYRARWYAFIYYVSPREI